MTDDIENIVKNLGEFSGKPNEDIYIHLKRIEMRKSLYNWDAAKALEITRLTLNHNALNHIVSVAPSSYKNIKDVEMSKLSDVEKIKTILTTLLPDSKYLIGTNYILFKAIYMTIMLYLMTMIEFTFYCMRLCIVTLPNVTNCTSHAGIWNSDIYLQRRLTLMSQIQVCMSHLLSHLEITIKLKSL